MRIILLSDDFPPQSFGGAGIVAFEQARELKKRGHEVHVLTATHEQGSEGESEYEGLILHKLYTKKRDLLRSYYAVYDPSIVPKAEALLRKLRPDVVHAHNIHSALSYG